MLQKNTSGLYTSTILSSLTGITHGFSTRTFGDARNMKNRKRILASTGLPSARLVWQKQVHGIAVGLVDEMSCGDTIPDTDALVFADGRVGSGVSPILSVHTADCVPMLFVDPAARILAVAHAGWRGTIFSLASHSVRAMVKHGARRDRIIVTIGPHIGACCYNVPHERARRFLVNDRYTRAISMRQGQWYLDLASVNTAQMVDAGISADHIDGSNYCTSCRVDEFFSYRKDTGETYGEIMGFIAFTA